MLLNDFFDAVHFSPLGLARELHLGFGFLAKFEHML